MRGILLGHNTFFWYVKNVLHPHGPFIYDPSLKAFTKFYSTVNMSCGRTNVKILFYCEYVLRTDKCVEKAFSTVNMSCGRTNVKILFYCEYVLRTDKCVEKAFSTVNMSCGRTKMSRFYFTVNIISCGRTNAYVKAGATNMFTGHCS